MNKYYTSKRNIYFILLIAGFIITIIYILIFRYYSGLQHYKQKYAPQISNNSNATNNNRYSSRYPHIENYTKNGLNKYDNYISKDRHIVTSEANRASLEICVVDAESSLPITAGYISIANEQSKSIISGNTINQSGCVRFLLLPARYSILYDIPNYYIGASDNIAILDNISALKKIKKCSKLLTIRGIVKNALMKPEPDTTLAFARSTSPSSLSIVATYNTNINGEFAVNIPSNYKDIIIFTSKPPYPITKVGPIDINKDTNRHIEIILPKEDKDTRISGIVTDTAANRISGATIRIASVDSNPKDRFMSMISNIYQQITKSDKNGSFSLYLSQPNNGIFMVQADGYEYYQEPLSKITQGEMYKNIRLNHAYKFTVNVTDMYGREVDGTTIKAENTTLSKTDKDNEYYSARYPFVIYADGIKSNMGITKKVSVDKFMSNIPLTLGSCNVNGMVTDENDKPIRNFSLIINSIGTTINDRGIPIFEITEYYSSNGSFTLNNIIPGTISLTIQMPSDELYQSNTLSLELLEGETVKPVIVLKKKR